VSDRQRWWHGRWPSATVAALSSLSLWFVAGGWINDDFVHIARLSTASVSDIFRHADPFGFYRPLAHLTLLAQGRLFGFTPAALRATNVLIHIVVCLLVLAVARRQMSPRAALLATLAFVLTPKAHTVAVLWVSARPELVMSLFSLLAILCWLRWDGREVRWLVLTTMCYVAAFLAKETAALLPILLLFTSPSQSRVSFERRLLPVAAISVSALIPLYLRIAAGGLMPGTGDHHYFFDLTAGRFFRSFEIYLPRALPSAAALVLVVGLPGLIRWRTARDVATQSETARWAGYGMLWFLVFLLPVFPIAARSELYLYLPGAGWCFLCGYLVDRLLVAVEPPPRLLVSLLAIYIVAALSFQIVRNLHAREVQRFTAAFVEAVREDDWFRTAHGSVMIEPTDSTTEGLLREGVGGYIDAVLANALGSTRMHGAVAYADRPQDSMQTQKVLCTFSNGHVLLAPTAPKLIASARQWRTSPGTA
jgi:hypothetical protein